MEDPLAPPNQDEERRRREEQQEEEFFQRLLREQQEQEDEESEQEEEEDQPDDDDELEPVEFNEPTPPRLTYRKASFLAALALTVYALRTREQFYLAAVYLSSSKWAYVIFGNAIVAFLITLFDGVCYLFLGGLRLHEAEGLQDFFRWNVTETCLALSLFRYELSVSVAVQCLALITLKCWHHVAAMREQHLRLTQDGVVGDAWPRVRKDHLLLYAFLWALQALDLIWLHHSITILMARGVSVQILLAFECAILVVSAWSHLLLGGIHQLDSLLHWGHEKELRWGQRWLHVWKEYKATVTFAVELQAQFIQFLFYAIFFSIVMSTIGIPLSLLREVYVSFVQLKQRISAFYSYRVLMAQLNAFETPTEEELEEAGATCIICRDPQTPADSKKLPSCQHIFHSSCLREWLVQQQSCPTCRKPIRLTRLPRATPIPNPADIPPQVQADDEQQEAEVPPAPEAPPAEPQTSNQEAVPAVSPVASEASKKERRVSFQQPMSLYRTKDAVVACKDTNEREIEAGVLVVGELIDEDHIQIPDGSWVLLDKVECLHTFGKR